MDILAKLRFTLKSQTHEAFLMNPEDVFDIPEISKRSKVASAMLRKEIKLLCDVDLLSSALLLNDTEAWGKEGASIRRK